MSSLSSRLFITGATGQLGRLVIAELLRTVPPSRVVALARDPGKAADLAGRGVEVRAADYDRPDTLDAALAGAGRVLLVSGSEVGRRVPQHRAVIAAAARAGAELVAYTSVLHADTSPLVLAEEHRETEAALAAAGVPFTLLRNGWYTENQAAGIPAALAGGAVVGSAGSGRFSAAARADYAAAAAAVLLADGQAGRVYELAGDDGYTLAEFAAEVARQSGKPVAYRDVPEAELRTALVGAGLPGPLAAALADSDAGAAKGGLFDDSRQLSRLIGRPTTPLSAVVAEAMKK